MADTTDTATTTSTAPVNTTAKANHTRGDINQGWLDDLTEAEGIVTAARKAEYASALADGDIDAAKVDVLKAAIRSARTLAGQGVQHTSGKQTITSEEEGFKQELIRQIQLVQKRARQKYDAADPGKLGDYAVGRKFYSSRSLLEQTAVNILLKLNGDGQAAADTLPGIKADKITALQKALEDYRNVQGDQIGAQGSATTTRKELEAAIADIETKRREIQFAADAEWPHEAPANTGIRMEFQLPPDRVMK